MGGEVCYQKGREKGPWFQIQEVVKVIKLKESATPPEDASFERKLLKDWEKYEGYEGAGNAYRALERPTRKPLK